MLVEPAVVTILDILFTPLILLLISSNQINHVRKYGIFYSLILYFLFIPIIFLCNDYLDLQTTPIIICLSVQLYFLTNREEKNILFFNKILTIIYIFEIIRYFLNAPFYLLNAFDLSRNIIVIFGIYMLEYLGTAIMIRYIDKQYPLIEVTFFNDISYTKLIAFSLLFQEFFFYVQQVNNKYEEMIIYSFLFMLTSIFFFYLLFRAQYNNIENILSKEKVEQEVIALQKYSSLIIEKQNQLRKFRHDYKNLILTLSSLVHENKIGEVKTYLQELNTYSQEQLEMVHVPFNELNIIENSIIRGFLLSKLLEFELENIPFQFLCNSDLNEVNLDNFNLIRILGIYLDNALEHLSEYPVGKFFLHIQENSDALLFTIKNSYQGEKLLIREIIQQGFSTKAAHSGQGLDTIEVLKQKHPQLSVQYKQGEFFEVHLIIEKAKE